MTIEIRSPELERLVQEEILSGHFQNADELLTEALQAFAREENPLRLHAAPSQESCPISAGVAFRRV